MTLFHAQDMGTVVMGKVESGGVMKGLSLLMMPNRVSAYMRQNFRFHFDKRMCAYR